MVDAGQFFQELNEAVQELCFLRQRAETEDAAVDASLHNLRLILKHINGGFGDEKTLEEAVIRSALRPTHSESNRYHQSLEWIKRYLALRSELEQQFQSNSDLPFVFLAFFADQVARAYDH
jgi:hypothetical protein